MAQTTDKVDDNKSQKEQLRLEGDTMTEYIDQPDRFQQTLKDPGETAALPPKKMNNEDENEKVLPKMDHDHDVTDPREIEQLPRRLQEELTEKAELRSEGDTMTECVEPGRFKQTLKDPGETAALPPKKMNNEVEIEKVLPKIDADETNRSEVEELRWRLQEERTEKAKLTLKLGDALHTITKLKQDVEQLKQGSKKSNDVISHLEDVRKKDEVTIALKNSELEEWKDKDKKSTEEIKKMKKLWEIDKERLAKLGEDLNNSQSQIEELERDMRSQDRKIDKMDKDLESRDRQISLLQAFESSSTSNMTEGFEMLTRQNSTLTDKIDELTRQMSTFGEQHEFYREGFENERREKERYKSAHRLLLQWLMAERSENEFHQRLANQHLQEAERAEAVIGVARTVAQRALNGLVPVGPNLHDVAEVNNIV